MVMLNGLDVALKRRTPTVINGGSGKQYNGLFDAGGPQEVYNSVMNGAEIPLITSSGCVLYLPGLPGQGNKILDYSGNNNHGTITGATWERLVSGLVVNRLDGLDDVIACGNSQTLKPTTALTLECVFLTTDKTHNCGILYRGSWAGAHGVYQLVLDTNNLSFRINGAGSSSETAWALSNLSNNTGYHVVGTYDKSLESANQVLYVNGVQRHAANYTSNLDADANITRIGTYYTSGAGLSFVGWIGLCNISNSAATASQVAGRFQQIRHVIGV